MWNFLRRDIHFIIFGQLNEQKRNARIFQNEINTGVYENKIFIKYNTAGYLLTKRFF